MKEDNIIQTEYSEVMEKSYIDYAMSVIIQWVSIILTVIHPFMIPLL